MFAIDPTEARSNSALPLETISKAVIVPGLEEFTGADFLISPLDAPPLTEITDSLLSQAKLRTHCEAGLLGQRKSGFDVINFIKDHHYILPKMREWTPNNAWILLSGTFTSNNEGDLIVNGQVAMFEGNRPWSYYGLRNSLRSWQLEGGYWDEVSRDSLLTLWMANMHTKLHESLNGPRVLSPRKPSQDVIVMGGGNTPEERQLAYCLIFLQTLPGIGPTMAQAIATYCDGKAKRAMEFITDPNNLKLKGVENFPARLGPVAFANARQAWGLDSGGEGVEQWLEVLTTTVVSVATGKEQTAEPPPWN